MYLRSINRPQRHFAEAQGLIGGHKKSRREDSQRLALI
jgi:hypothetical protein